MPEVQESVLGQRKENWKPVVGWEGLYEVSDMGRVKSLPKSNRTSELLMTQEKNHNGHLKIIFCRGNKIYSRFVHRLVLSSHKRTPAPGEVCRHLNGNPADNRIENLVWGNMSDNIADAMEHGTYPVGENHLTAKYANSKVKRVFALRKKGMSHKQIAGKVGVSRSSVSKWLSGELRGDVRRSLLHPSPVPPAKENE